MTSPKNHGTITAAKYILSGLLLIIIGLAAFLFALARVEHPVQYDTNTAATIHYTPLTPLVPGPTIPPELPIMSSNNNIDVTRFDGRFFLAFRTAPTHFASSQTRLIVLSSTDRTQWQPETTFNLGSDLREPRFLVFNNQLFLYFFQAGSNPFGFEPRSILATQRTAPNQWTTPKPIFSPGYVVWRAKTLNDTAYMSVYLGAGLYTTQDRPGDVRLLTSHDGWDWHPISQQPQIADVSAEEGEFEFDKEGNLVATIRLETHGALLCTAPHDDLTHWNSRYLPDKYDSALMFRRENDFYLIARRNVAGPFETENAILPKTLHRAWRMMAFSLTRKRTALYRIDLQHAQIVPVFDFPSRGDTAYPALLPLDANSYYLVNYSCDVSGCDWPWLAGQLLGTRLYETILTFDAPASTAP